MPIPHRTQVAPGQLRKAFKKDLADAWAFSRKRHSNHTPYAFVLFGVEGDPRLSPHVLTEESLTQVAQHYVEKGHYETLDEAREALRYSVADSPLFSETETRIPTVDALFGPHARTLDETAGYRILAKAAIKALKELDSEGNFGVGRERERLLLAIITFDTEEDWSSRSVRQLNPPAVVERFEAHSRDEGEHVSCGCLHVTPDGKTLYTAECCSDPDATPGSAGGSISEVMAYDVEGVNLVRRWRYTFPAWGNNVQGLAGEPDGKSLLLLRAQYLDGKGKCQALLTRLDCSSGHVLRELCIEGEPHGFALSRDGSRIVVPMYKKMHLVDGQLNLVRTSPLDTPPGSGVAPRFLASGELLVGTQKAITRLDLTAGVSTALASDFTRLIGTDDAERFLLVSRWQPVLTAERRRPVEFGVRLLGLPALTEIRTFLIAGHQARRAAISPDGRWVAFHACEIAGPRMVVVVFDAASGREVARRKCDYVHDMAFCSDSRTLIVAHSAFAPAAPIDLWPLPQ